MRFELTFEPEAEENLKHLKQTNPKKHKKVLKTLGLMETNLKHPSLQTHKYSDLEGAKGETVFESYVENRTPGAFRVFWHYGQVKQTIIIISITPHP